MTSDVEHRLADSAKEFIACLERGVPADEAIGVVHSTGRHPDVVSVGVEMLAETGHLDMKKVAAKAGMSRASLYRYYTDRFQLEAEIAALGIESMVAAAASHAHKREKLRAAFEFLVDHPGHAAAIVAQAATVSAGVMGATAEGIAGDAAFAPLIAGIAVLSATPARADDDVEVIHALIDRLLGNVD